MSTMERSRGRLSRGACVGRALATQPYEGIERVRERIAERWDQHASPFRYEVTQEWEERLHGFLSASWPCLEQEQANAVWQEMLQDLAARGLQIGRGTFGGWDDGDLRLGRAAWCLTRHLSPNRVVETGVARGLVTRMILEALERNGHGRLWSIDLPPLLETVLAEETGVAVPEGLHKRWELLRGSSRRILPQLLRSLGQIDLFLHDSMHTTRNVVFELEHVWPALSDEGAALLDDVEKNAATKKFIRAHPGTPVVVSPSYDEKVLLACLVKHG